jgi:hypothetical protein
MSEYRMLEDVMFRAGGVGQVVEHLPIHCEALSSDSSNKAKQNTKKDMMFIFFYYVYVTTTNQLKI